MKRRTPEFKDKAPLKGGCMTSRGGVRAVRRGENKISQEGSRMRELSSGQSQVTVV